MSYRYQEPAPRAEGIWFCVPCWRMREFEALDSEGALGGRAGREDIDLFCTTCNTEMPKATTVVERWPAPPMVTSVAHMSKENFEAGRERLRLVRMALIPPDDTVPAAPPITEDDIAQQVRQIMHSQGYR